MTPLARATQLLEARLVELEAKVREGADDPTWQAFSHTAMALAQISAQVAPGSQGELLTTREMAERLGLAPKTLLKHAAAGTVRPAVRKGKLIRWKGDEVPR
jgi:hypothetical protein